MRYVGSLAGGLVVAFGVSAGPALAAPTAYDVTQFFGQDPFANAFWGVNQPAATPATAAPAQRAATPALPQPVVRAPTPAPSRFSW